MFVLTKAKALILVACLSTLPLGSKNSFYSLPVASLIIINYVELTICFMLEHKSQFTTAEHCRHRLSERQIDFSDLFTCSVRLKFFAQPTWQLQHEFFNKSLRWRLISMKIRFKIHIKLYSVVYTVGGARPGCHIAHFVLAQNPERNIHLDTLGMDISVILFGSTMRNLERDKQKVFYLIWEIRDNLNFYYNEVLAVLFLLARVCFNVLIMEKWRRQRRGK